MTGEAGDTSERRRIHHEVAATLFVEAGAGTGKTSALVERIATLVAGGHARLGEIAAITFTEAAAAELRERIRSRMEGLLAQSDDPVVAGRAAVALDDIDDAPLLTLHGFANRILSAHAVEAGLPPGFQVRDAVEASVDFDRRWTAFLGHLVRDPEAEPALRTALRMGLTVDHLRQLAVQLHESWDLVEERPALAHGRVGLDAGPLDEAFARARRWAERCTDPADKLLHYLSVRLPEHQREVAAALEAAGDDVAAVARALAVPAPRPGGVGSQRAWPVPPKAVRDEVIEGLESARLRVLQSVGQHVLAELLPHLVGFTLDGATSRADTGVLEYHDLLVRARRLLRRDPAVRAAVRRRFRYLLVDEFQDTDPIQVDLVVLAATTDDAPIDHATPWSALPVEPGRLFFVGDPKQSIYRFRRADIQLYASVRDELGKDACPLVTNWRSVPAVIDVVNRTFEPWFRSQEGQAPWAALEAGRAGGPGLGVVAVLGGPLPDHSAEEVREATAADVASAIEQAIGGGWAVADDAEPGGSRAARLDDITVLLPTRTALPALERALADAGIAYRVEARSLVWSTQEVRDLLSTLHAVGDPSDEVAAVAALTSGVFACSWDDLVAWRLRGGSWSHAAAVPDGSPVGDAMGALGHWAEDARWTDPATLLERIVRERALLESAFARSRQRESWNRVRFLLEQARTWVGAGGSGLRQFVAWAERQADERAQALESVVPEADDEAVRILTIHSAKGLEFPITIVAGLNVKRYQPVGSVAQVLWGRDGPVELSCGRRDLGFQTRGFEALRAVDDTMAEHELTRLLYVACTRARDHLVVCVHHKGGDREEWTTAERLHSWIESVDGIVRGIDALRAIAPGAFERRPQAPAAGPTPPDAAAASAALVAAAERQAAARRASARASVVAATAVAHHGHEQARPTLDLGPVVTPEVLRHDPAASLPVDGEGSPPAVEVRGERPGASGTVLGTAVHAALERLVRGGVDSTPHSDAVAHAEAERAGADAIATAAAVRAALTSPAAGAARAATRRWSEVFVAAPAEGLVVEGFVDLLHTEGDGLVIVDWKTDRVADAADREAKAEGYAVQLACYAVALEAATALPVRRLSIVFCGHGDAHQVDVEGERLVAAVQEARRRLSAVRAGP